VTFEVRGPIIIDPRTWSPGASGVDAHRARRLDEPGTATPRGTPVTPAMPGHREDGHSPVGVPTAPAAPLPEKRQREQPLHRSLHLVTSALD